MNSRKCQCQQCVEIPITNGANAGYETIRFQVDQAYCQRSIWLVKPAALASVKRPDIFAEVPAVETWGNWQKKHMLSFLNPKLDGRFEVRHAFMPRLTVLHDRVKVRPNILSRMLGKKPQELTYSQITFGNGRHRTAMSAMLGAEFIPIQMTDESAKYLCLMIGEDNVVSLQEGLSCGFCK